MAHIKAEKKIKLEPGTAAFRIMQVLVLSGGEASYDSLKLMPYKPITRSKAIERLSSEGIIEIKTTKGLKKIRLKLFDKNKSLYLSQLWTDAEGYKIDDQHAAGIGIVKRKHALSELYMMLTDTETKITPDALNRAGAYASSHGGIEEKSSLLPVFIPSKRCKYVFNYNVTKNDPNREAKTNARYNGALISPSGCFMIYNLGSGLSEWGTDGEKGAADMAADIRKNLLGSWAEKYISLGTGLSTEDMRNRFIDNGAILYAKNYDDFIYCFQRAAKGKRKNKKIGAECFTGSVAMADNFRNVYALPLNTDGTILTNLMLKPEWRYRLTGLFVKDKNRATDAMRQYHDIDGTSDSGRKIVCFTDCDIRRLAGILEDIRQNPGQYQLICYDFQEPLLRKLIEDVRCEILACTVQDVTEALKD